MPRGETHGTCASALEQVARVEIGVPFGAKTEDSSFQQQQLGEHGYREDDVNEDDTRTPNATVGIILFLCLLGDYSQRDNPDGDGAPEQDKL